MNAQPRDKCAPGLSPDASFEDAALIYAGMGLRVFPTRPNTKEPYANKDHGLSEADKGNGGYKVATCDPATIKRWAKRWPQANIGIAIDGFIVVEADVRHDGPANLERFRTQHGIAIDTVEARSASGGPHYFFRDIPGLRRAIGVLPGVDFLASGAGFVMVAPSRKGAGVYTWVEGRAPWDRPMAELPTALREAIEQSHEGRAYSYKAKRANAGSSSAPRSQTVTDPDAYMRKVVDNVTNAVASVKEGERREVLNRESFTLGRFVGGGYIRRDEARDLIASAFRQAGHRLDSKAEDTIDVALDEGAAQPIRFVVAERARTSTASSPDDGDVPDDGCDAGGGEPTFIHDRPTTDTSGMVSVDAGFLKKLMMEAAAAGYMRARWQRAIAVVGDGVMNDGQKLTQIVLDSKLPVACGDTPPPPVVVSAETVARALGSRVTKQKDGTDRPTKLGTVAKNLADLVSLGTCQREAVERVKTITIPHRRDARGQPLQKTITVTSYAYQSGGVLPGQHMSRDEARAAATGAKADRERPRCARCYSDKLQPGSYVCDKCDHVTSAVDAMRAAHDLVDRGNGEYLHRDTGEIIVPGIPVIEVVAATPPVTGIQRQEDAGGGGLRGDAVGDDTHTRPVAAGSAGDAGSAGRGYRNPVTAPPASTRIAGAAEREGSHYRNPVTIVRPKQGYRIPVMAPVQAMRASLARGQDATVRAPWQDGDPFAGIWEEGGAS